MSGVQDHRECGTDEGLTIKLGFSNVRQSKLTTG